MALSAIFALAACDRASSGRAAVDRAAAIATDAQVPPTRLTAPAPSQARADAFVLPGAFAADTTVADLQQRYGKANVRIGELPGAEGEVHRGVRLFPDDPARQADVYFQDERSLRGLSLVSIRNEGSRWTLDNGIRIGQSLANLVALNGAPIVFTGFDWDYGGYVSDWSDGKLQDGDGDAVQSSVRLRIREAGDKRAQGAYPMGDGEFRSDDPAYPKLGGLAEVGQISVTFPGQDDL